MRDTRKLLADLKRQLKQQPAPKRAVSSSPPEDDASALFRQAIAGARELPASRQAEIPLPQPEPIRRHQSVNEDREKAAKHRKEDWLPDAWLKDDTRPAELKGDALVLAEALRGTRPILNDRVTVEAPKPAPLPIQHDRDERAALVESIYAPTSLELHLEGGDELFYLANGVPRSILRDLRRGRWVVQESVDLHGCNREEARELLAAFVAKWRKHGVRCVRVVHGKGRGSPRKDPVLKKLVAGWLMNYDCVAAYCQARLVDGGAGALVVLFKSQRPKVD